MYIFFFIINRSLKVHVNVTEQNKQVTKMLMASDNYTLITLNRTIMWKHNRTEPQPRRSVKKPVTVPRSLSNQSLLSLSPIQIHLSQFSILHNTRTSRRWQITTTFSRKNLASHQSPAVFLPIASEWVPESFSASNLKSFSSHVCIFLI